MGKRWLHMSAETRADAEGACRDRHEATGRGDLSVTENIAGSECVIKVADAAKSWRKSQAWMGDCLGIYAEDDHGALATIMMGADWRGEEQEPPQ